jgi:hypothetical protein
MRLHPFAWVIEPFARFETEEQAYRIERLLIGLFDMQREGYNIAFGGRGGRKVLRPRPEKIKKFTQFKHGHTMSLEVREKISATLKGRPKPHLVGKVPWNKGIKVTWSEAARERIANRNTINPPRLGHFGYNPTIETREKLRNAALAQWERKRNELQKF